MLVVAASTDKLAQAAKTSAVTVVMYGVVVGNYALNGGFTVYSYVAGMLFAVIGLGILTPRIGLKKAMIIGSWGGIVLNSLMALLWLFGDPKTLSLPGYVNGNGQAFGGINFFTGALFLLAGIFLTYGMLVIGNIFNLIAMRHYPLSKEKMIEIQEKISEIKSGAERS